MLYECWRRAASLHPDGIALWDLAKGQRWSFRQLAVEAEAGSTGASRLVLPQGNSPEFILTVLRAWREGKVVCPLEMGQTAPVVAGDFPSGIVHLKTTSATTGFPRLVAFRASQLIADAENIVSTMGLCPEWPNLGVISLAHSYGFSNLVLPLLLHGVPLYIAGGALPEVLRHSATSAPELTLAAVPALWQAWLEANVLPQNVRLAISAGAPLPVTLEQSVFSQFGLKIHNFYGSTECGGIAYDAATLPRVDGACAGAPMRNVTLAQGSNGCLEVCSRAVGETYWPEPDEALGQGRFRTSDLGELIDGLVFLRGRAGDQINVAGRKVLPETIEQALSAHPSVRACLAFGVPSPDPQRGETIVACVSGTADATGESLRQFAILKLPAWQVPREWWFVEGLTPDGRGKLSRAVWRRRYLERTSG